MEKSYDQHYHFCSLTFVFLQSGFDLAGPLWINNVYRHLLLRAVFTCIFSAVVLHIIF